VGKRPDLVLTADYAIPGDGGQLIRDAVVAVSRGRILDVGARGDLHGLVRIAVTHRHFGNAVLLPGLVNAHCHLESFLA
jgi:cytosine/adenosine deaminase-related metal-dependent hydrolase